MYVGGIFFMKKVILRCRILYHCALAGLAWADDADRAVGRSKNQLGQVVFVIGII